MVRRQVRAAENHVATVLRGAQATPHDRVVLIGHSYGGNIAYNLSTDARPDLPGQQPADGLVTFDPIDWNLCQPRLVNICNQSNVIRPVPAGVSTENILNFVQRNPNEPLLPFPVLQPLHGFIVSGAMFDDRRARGPDGILGTADDTTHELIDEDASPGNDGVVGTEDDASLGIFPTILSFLRGLVAS